MQKTISKDSPLAEITLRKYEKPYDMPRRELIRKLCLSIGLLQPGDSRDSVVDVLQTLLDTKEPISSEDVEKKVIEQRKENKLPLKGICSSNIRRQLKRLRDLYLVEKLNNDYRINECDTLCNIFNEKIEGFYLKSIIERVREYFNALK